ncbi:MAG: DUF559 domain-containing protein, partial [Bacteroidota bacterium]
MVDFICLEQRAYDIERTRYLNKLGYHLLRFWNNQVLNQDHVVLEKIWITLIRPSGTFSRATLRDPHEHLEKRVNFQLVMLDLIDPLII